MTLRFTAPSWDLVIVATGGTAMTLFHAWPAVLLAGVASLALLQVRLARATRAEAYGRGSKLNRVLTWVVGVNAITLTLLRALAG
ncbi:MAG: hypothetical protein ACOZQL_13100 [Myxococcota bacterium]